MQRITRLKAACLGTCLVLSTLWLQVEHSEAHGFIKSPESRSYTASLEKQSLGYSVAFEKYGSVINAPQAVEGLKGFPLNGPADGKIASGNGGSGQIDFALDKQSASLWNKVNLTGGIHNFTWQYTAPHATSKWHYYITKKDWDPNQPLSRKDLELIATISHNGTAANNNLTHQVNIPTDRQGYHIILGVWDIADTANAFYQVIDVNLQNDVQEDAENPSTPTHLVVHENDLSNVDISWEASSDNNGIKEYVVYRNGEKIGTTPSNSFKDLIVSPNNTYSYTVKAIDLSGNASSLSEEVTITTKELSTVDNTPPSAPSGLHTMGITAESVSLMWGTSSDLSGVKEYQVFRNEKLIAQTSSTSFKDDSVSSNTTYSYAIKAVDIVGNVSLSSNILAVTTESLNMDAEWSIETIYVAGDHVMYKGNEYIALWWTQGSQPDKLNGWKLVADNHVLQWQVDASYVGGAIVEYEGSQYRAKWWTMGDNPSSSAVWELIQ